VIAVIFSTATGQSIRGKVNRVKRENAGTPDGIPASWKGRRDIRDHPSKLPAGEFVMAASLEPLECILT